MTPTVSFVVPCYKLAHLLQECVNSILGQTYNNFEVLIMDDCSPDNTREVAQSFYDSRVKYIRNDPNLGHLRNYNKGISLTRGKYVWLISADDYLRRPYVLERYVNLLERNPRVGYTFCPGMGVRDGVETGTVDWCSVYGDRDRIIEGHILLGKLIRQNTIVAASGMARRECYEKISYFPLNMPWAGDWYLWCVFALHFDVGYFAEPMVCYREHDLSMTSILMRENAEYCAGEVAAMPFAIKHKADEAEYRDLSRDCLRVAISLYVWSITSRLYEACRSSLTLEQFEESLGRNVVSEREKHWVRARVYAGMADQYYSQGELSVAKRFYLAGLRQDPRMVKVLAKWVLLALGHPGEYVRRTVRWLRQIRTLANRC